MNPSGVRRLGLSASAGLVEMLGGDVDRTGSWWTAVSCGLGSAALIVTVAFGAWADGGFGAEAFQGGVERVGKVGLDDLCCGRWVAWKAVLGGRFPLGSDEAGTKARRTGIASGSLLSPEVTRSSCGVDSDGEATPGFREGRGPGLVSPPCR